MSVKPNEGEETPAVANENDRPPWVAPELVELKIWSDTLGSNIALLGDNVLTRVTPAS